MRLVVGFLAFLPTMPGRIPIAVSDGLRAKCDAAGLALIREGAYALAIQPSGTNMASSDSAVLLDVFPGTACSGRKFAVDGAEASHLESLHAMAECEAQAYNLIQADQAAFVLESDAIGLKPFYVAKVDGGTLLASRIADILALYPQLVAVDQTALYELMTFRTPIAQRTLHKGIRRGLPGACYRWSVDTGLAADQARRPQPPPLNVLAFVDETIARIKEAVCASLREKTTHAQGQVALALSGGFDSRLIAAVAAELAIPMRVLSYGRRHTSETHSAVAVAEALGLKLEPIEYPPDNSLRHLSWHLTAVEGTADLATSSIANLLATDLPVGTSLLHGYVGDPLAGSFCNHLSAKEYVSSETLIDGIMRHHNAVASSGMHNVLTPAVDLEAVRSDLVATVRDDCPPHQAYLLWEFENRQRTYVGSYFALLGDRFDTVMPFYDRRVFDLWLSLPPIGQADRAVFRKLLARYYPQLARIPHSEEPAPITPNLRWQLARFYRGLPERTMTMIMGAERAHQLLLRTYRHDYIWNLGNLAAPRQRALMLSRVTELRPVLKEACGVMLSSDYAERLSGDVQALRGMFLAAEYARYVDATSAVAAPALGIDA